MGNARRRETGASAPRRDVAGAVSGVASAAGDIISSFFKYKTAEVEARTDPSRTAAISNDRPVGMSQGTKTALLVGGGVAVAALLLFAVMK